MPNSKATISQQRDASSQPESRFFSLPIELRNSIYNLVLSSFDRIEPASNSSENPKYHINYRNLTDIRPRGFPCKRKSYPDPGQQLSDYGGCGCLNYGFYTCGVVPYKDAPEWEGKLGIMVVCRRMYEELLPLLYPSTYIFHLPSRRLAYQFLDLLTDPVLQQIRKLHIAMILPPHFRTDSPPPLDSNAKPLDSHSGFIFDGKAKGVASGANRTTSEKQWLRFCSTLSTMAQLRELHIQIFSTQNFVICSEIEKKILAPLANVKMKEGSWVVEFPSAETDYAALDILDIGEQQNLIEGQSFVIERRDNAEEPVFQNVGGRINAQPGRSMMSKARRACVVLLCFPHKLVSSIPLVRYKDKEKNKQREVTREYGDWD